MGMIIFRCCDNELDWYHIRQSVFVEEQGFKNEFDSIDRQAIHITMYVDEVAAGCARIFKDGDAYRIGRVAILSEYRGNGYGTKLMQYVEHKINEMCANKIVLDAQCDVVSFYEQNGYYICGESHFDEHVAHIEMQKKMNLNGE